MLRDALRTGALKQMARAFGFRIQIGPVVLVGWKDMGYAFRYGYAMPSQGPNLCWVVSQKLDLINPQTCKHLNCG